MASKQGLRLGVTLFSLTNEFHGREYSFEQLIAKIGELRLGPGLEVVGFQSIRGFPEVSDEFADNFRNVVSKAGLEPSCLGLNADTHLRRDRPMTNDESLAYHEAQVRAAAKLGFPTVRYQYAAGTEVIERLLPLAEKLKVKLGLEIHAPESVKSPTVLRYREMYARHNSPYLGFVPDFGSAARRVSPAFMAYFRRLGIPEHLLELGDKMWHGPGDPLEKMQRFEVEARAIGAKETHIAEMFIIFGLFSPQDPKAWLEIMPQVVHIHGKFYAFDENGSESAIPYEELLPVFVQAGYNGYMSSEWEGHFFSDESGFPKLLAHRALCERILAAQNAN